jgi:hypothetical protein
MLWNYSVLVTIQVGAAMRVSPLKSGIGRLTSAGGGRAKRLPREGNSQ